MAPVTSMSIPLGPAFSLPSVENLAIRDSHPSRERRLAAWRRFEEAPWPSRTDEEWRRTDLSRLDLAGLAALGESRTTFRGDVTTGTVPQGDLTATGAGGGSKFRSLNEALCGATSLVRVTEGRRASAAIRHEAVGTLFPRTRVELGRESRAFILEELGGGGEAPGLASSVTELEVGPGAGLVYVRVQELGGGFGNFEDLRAFLDRDSALTLVLVNTGGGLTKQFLDLRLMGEGSRLTVLCLSMLDGDRHLDVTASVAHLVGRTTSEVLAKNALTDRSRSVFVGTVRVDPGASGADAYETNRNLLLSPDARADSIPRLEIETDDVRCGHASSTGPLDDDQLFYLMCRGLPRGAAEKTIVEGFLEDVIGRIPLDGDDETGRLAARRAIAGALTRRKLS